MSTRIKSIPTYEHCIGQHPHGPSKCIYCGAMFRSGDRWLRMTSADDSALGCYTIGIHDGCALKSHEQSKLHSQSPTGKVAEPPSVYT